MLPYLRKTKTPTSNFHRIKIIGVGGAGVHCLKHLANTHDLPVLAIDSDERTLAQAEQDAPTIQTFLLNPTILKGFGTGGDPQQAEDAALESVSDLKAIIADQDLIIVLSGVGGGIGSGVMPVLTQLIDESGAMLIAVTISPFSFEGKRRKQQADLALEKIALHANALIMFENDRMGDLSSENPSVYKAFEASNLLVADIAKSIIRLLNKTALINTGVDDLISALKVNRGHCLFGTGTAHGSDRVQLALKQALQSPLINPHALLMNANNVLVNLSGGQDLTLLEIELLMQQLQPSLSENAHVLFSTCIDPTLEQGLTVTIISAISQQQLQQHELDELKKIQNNANQLDPKTGFVGLKMNTYSEANEAELPSISNTSDQPVSHLQPVITSDRDDSLFSEISEDHIQSIQEEPAEPALAQETDFQLNSTMNDVVVLQEKELLSEPSYTTVFEVAEPVSSTSNEPLLEPVQDEALPETANQSSILAPLPVAPIVPISLDEPELAMNSDRSPIKPQKRAPSLFEIDESPPSFKPLPVASTADEDVQSSTHSFRNLFQSIREAQQKNTNSKSSSTKHNEDELPLHKALKGKFEGTQPNMIGGEDLDLPPFLRKKS